MEILLVIAGVALVYYFAIYNKPLQNEWEKLPSLQEYAAKHGQVASERDISCYKCKSKTTYDTGLTRVSDFRRKIICGNCKLSLYREQD